VLERKYDQNFRKRMLPVYSGGIRYEG